MSKKTQRYKNLFLSLFPNGKIWERREGSNLDKLSSVITKEFSRVDDTAKLMIEESDPRTAFNYLGEWERSLGLPDDCTCIGLDECSMESKTLEDRRRTILQKLTTGGGSDEPFFAEICRQLGYADIKARSFYPFKMGQSQMGDRLTNEGWEYVFEVASPIAISRAFMMGQSQMGEPLRSFGNPSLECTIERLKPAHTTVLFSFGSTGSF